MDPAHLVGSFRCWMVPGGSVSRVRVLLTAMVILHGLDGSARSKLPISASKGRCPPSCTITFTPFTHCKKIISDQLDQTFTHRLVCGKRNVLNSYSPPLSNSEHFPLSGQFLCLHPWSSVWAPLPPAHTTPSQWNPSQQGPVWCRCSWQGPACRSLDPSEEHQT